MKQGHHEQTENDWKEQKKKRRQAGEEDDVIGGIASAIPMMEWLLLLCSRALQSLKAFPSEWSAL